MGVAYGIATWVLMQIVDVIAPVLLLPEIVKVNEERDQLGLDPVDPFTEFWQNP